MVRGEGAPAVAVERPTRRRTARMSTTSTTSTSMPRRAKKIAGSIISGAYQRDTRRSAGVKSSRRDSLRRKQPPPAGLESVPFECTECNATAHAQLPGRSGLHEGHQVSVDRLGLGGRRAVRESGASRRAPRRSWRPPGRNQHGCRSTQLHPCADGDHQRVGARCINRYIPLLADQ